jgi:hypothetical protein
LPLATWVPLIVAVLSALLAGYFTNRSRSAEFQAQRILDLERRLAASKGEIFQPFIEAIGRFWERIAQDGDVPPNWAEKNVLPHFQRFGHWVQVYGSDDSARLYHRYMQAIFHDAPRTSLCGCWRN